MPSHRPYLTNVECPNCHAYMTYEPEIPARTGGPPDNWDPGSSSDLWCGHCGHTATDEEIKDFEETSHD